MRQPPPAGATPLRRTKAADEEHDIEVSENVEKALIGRGSITISRRGAVVAVALAAFFVGWLVVGRDGEDPVVPDGRTASEAELRSFAATVSHPVYWAGAKDAHTYELTRTTDGRIYVRYLPEGTKGGDPRARFLTVGTYPRPTAFAELQRAARAEGAVSLKLGRGGIAVFNEARPTSVYIGYREARYQVEVYHPSADEARRVALSGQVVPVR